MNRAHPKTPCENCPYRKDVPTRLWHRAEFEGVLAAEGTQFGSVYSCHKHAALPRERRGFCAGWLLDQKARRLPSIALRLALCHEPESVEALKVVTDGGHPMFKTVKAMCRANGVRKR